MTTLIRPKLSSKNEYYISKERYYELKHFCLQYPEWKKAYQLIEDDISPHGWDPSYIRGTNHGDPTMEKALQLSHLSRNMELVEKCAVKADEDLAPYILKSVTEGYSYTYLVSVMDMPAGKNMFYNRYRKFFWLLNTQR